jgi:hypothetical protein
MAKSFDEYWPLINEVFYSAYNFSRCDSHENEIRKDKAIDVLYAKVKELCDENQRLESENAILKEFLISSYSSEFSIYFDDEGFINFGSHFDEIPEDDENYNRLDATEEVATEIINKINVPAGFEQKEVELEHDYVTVSFEPIIE